MPDRRAPHAATLVALALTVAFAPGCNKLREKIMEKAAEKAAEKALEQQTGQKVDIEQGGGKITVQGKDGKGTFQAGAGVTLPATWPKEVPIYPGAAITASVTQDQEGKSGQYVMLETPDPIDKVAEFYKASLKGYKQTVDMNMGSARMLTLRDEAAKRDVALILSSQEGKTGVQLTVSAGAR